MKAWLLWAAIRGAFFFGLDAVAVHDFETSLAFWAAFTIFDGVNVMENRAVVRERGGPEL